MKSRAALVVALGALVVAGAVYATSRAGLRLHGWLDALGLTPPVTIAMPGFVRNVLPDVLWQYAFCVCVFVLWRGVRRTAVAVACLAVPIVVGVGSELAQAAALIEGVFDPLDLVGMMAATVAAYLTAGRPARKRRRASPHRRLARC